MARQPCLLLVNRSIFISDKYKSFQINFDVLLRLPIYDSHNGAYTVKTCHRQYTATSKTKMKTFIELQSGFGGVRVWNFNSIATPRFPAMSIHQTKSIQLISPVRSI